MALTAEQLLAGGAVTHEVAVPPDLIAGDGIANFKVVVRPLTVRDLQRIAAAARDDESMSASLMIQQALVEPALKFEQVSQLAAGLARFLVDQINSASGISTPKNALEEVVQAPLARACFVLAREFGWTPEQVSAMTIGQILLYLEMSRNEGNHKQP
jgi:hypothetical protein